MQGNSQWTVCCTSSEDMSLSVPWVEMVQNVGHSILSLDYSPRSSFCEGFPIKLSCGHFHVSCPRDFRRERNHDVLEPASLCFSTEAVLFRGRLPLTNQLAPNIIHMY